MQLVHLNQLLFKLNRTGLNPFGLLLNQTTVGPDHRLHLLPKRPMLRRPKPPARFSGQPQSPAKLLHLPPAPSLAPASRPLSSSSQWPTAQLPRRRLPLPRPRSPSACLRPPTPPPLIPPAAPKAAGQQPHPQLLRPPPFKLSPISSVRPRPLHTVRHSSPALDLAPASSPSHKSYSSGHQPLHQIISPAFPPAATPLSGLAPTGGLEEAWERRSWPWLSTEEREEEESSVFGFIGRRRRKEEEEEEKKKKKKAQLKKPI